MKNSGNSPLKQPITRIRAPYSRFRLNFNVDGLSRELEKKKMEIVCLEEEENKKHCSLCRKVDVCLYGRDYLSSVNGGHGLGKKRARGSENKGREGGQLGLGKAIN